jgi:hypothetical protein
LVYPVYGRRGLSGSIRSVLKNFNKKASALRWKEYHTEPKSLGKFGYWETEYNGIRIDLGPLQGLVHLMDDSTRRTVAGVEFMALNREQLETLLANAPEEEISGLGALEDDPIPIEIVNQHQPSEQKPKEVVEVQLWEELEQMSEGEARVMTRQFLYVDDIEIEICSNANGKHFVRHNVYWWINFGQKNPDPERNFIVDNLQRAVEALPTIRWSGYRFRLEKIVFSEDDVEVESILLPLGMFEDLIKDISKFSYLGDKIREEIQSGRYELKPNDSAAIKLCMWLQTNTLFSLLSTQNSNTNPTE